LQRLVDHRSVNPRPLIRVLGAENYKVNRDAEIAESFAKSHKLCSAAFQLGLNDKQIQIAVRTSLTSGARAEKDHRGMGRRSSEATARLRNQSLVSHGRSQSEA